MATGDGRCCFPFQRKYTLLLDVHWLLKVGGRDAIEGDVPLGWVENSTNNFFKDYPWIDILVHQEGEYTIKQIFEEYIGNKDYSKINGLETIDYRTLPQLRITNLDEIPSPYLTDLIWDLVEPTDGVEYISAWETNRGCPFACTFCDWGSATKTKVRKWEMD